MFTVSPAPFINGVRYVGSWCCTVYEWLSQLSVANLMVQDDSWEQHFGRYHWRLEGVH